MSDNTTIARPYAKAIFEFALQQHKLAEWSALLCCLAEAVSDPAAKRFINNPATTAEQQRQLLLAIMDSQHKAECEENLIHLLVANKRLLLLPEIYAQFEMLRAEQEKTIQVSVRSFTTLSESQQHQLAERLSQRLKRQVTLDISIDKTLLGGAVIRAGDLVIDDSVRGKLIKLGANLAA